jgi:hypothetical protein
MYAGSGCLAAHNKGLASHIPIMVGSDLSNSCVRTSAVIPRPGAAEVIAECSCSVASNCGR